MARDAGGGLRGDACAQARRDRHPGPRRARLRKKAAEKEAKDERAIKGKLLEEEAKLGESEEEYKAKIATRNAAQDERKELQRRDAEVDAELNSKTEEVKRRDKQLEFTMPRELFRGLSAVQRIVKDHGIKGVHGPLIELMECDERFFAAVEAAAAISCSTSSSTTTTWRPRSSST